MESIAPSGFAAIVAHNAFSPADNFVVATERMFVATVCAVFAPVSAIEAVRAWSVAAVSSCFFFV